MFAVFVQYLFLLSAYPLARWVLPRINSRQKALVFHITLGIAACSVLYRTRLLLAIIMIVTGYIILDYNPYYVFAIAYFMNTAVHFVQLVWPLNVRVKNLTKMIFFKIVATSFNLEDGRKVKEGKTGLNKRQKTFHLLKKPTFLEWIGYCFTPFGAISPSFYEFRLFEYILDVGKNPSKISDKSRSKAIECLKRSFVHFVIYYVFRHFFTLKFYKSEFFLSLNILFRILLVLILGIIIFSRDFMFWKVVDASLFEVGFLDSGLVEEDEFTSLTIENLLSQKTIKDWSKAFNHTNEIFWSNYLTLRGPESGLPPKAIEWIAFFCKPIYKGLCGGILLASFEKKLFVAAEKVLHTFAPRFTKETFWPEYIFTQVFMVLNRASMRFTTVYAFFYVNYVIYFIFWIVAAAMVGYGYYMEKNEASAPEKKEDDQQHVKKD